MEQNCNTDQDPPRVIESIEEEEELTGWDTDNENCRKQMIPL